MDGIAPLDHREPLPADRAPAELAPGTVWLLAVDLPERVLGAALASPALRRADAVLCDAGLPPGLLHAIRGRARYVEVIAASAAGRDAARRRCLALAREGWRIVRVFRREPVGAADAIVSAAALAEAGVGLRLDGVAGAAMGSAEIEPQPAAVFALPRATASFAGSAG
jgi:hypothetical protein